MKLKPLFKNPLENVVAFSPPETGIYLGSPSIALLPDGKIVVSHDFFGPNCPRNEHGMPDTTRIFVSNDGGRSWEMVSEIKGAYWSTIFFYKDSLYLLGTSAKYGDIVIRRSGDGGKTWTKPIDEDSGLLFKGGEGDKPPNYHCAPVPVLFYRNRIWRAFEDNVSGKWPDGFQALVISAKVGSDLFKSSSWVMTNKLPYDPTTDPPEFGSPDEESGAKRPGWLEGNVVAGLNGQVYNILRVNSAPVANKAAVTKVSNDGRKLSFDPKTGFIDFPGGMSKFTIRFDNESKRYITLSNLVINPRNPWQRNVLVLASSKDLFRWECHVVLLYEWENERLVNRESKIGFQYVDWLIDGDDLLFVSRTAYKGAPNFHDANYITFHRLKNFRKYLEIKLDFNWKK